MTRGVTGPGPARSQRHCRLRAEAQAKSRRFRRPRETQRGAYRRAGPLRRTSSRLLRGPPWLSLAGPAHCDSDSSDEDSLLPHCVRPAVCGSPRGAARPTVRGANAEQRRAAARDDSECRAGSSAAFPDRPNGAEVPPSSPAGREIQLARVRARKSAVSLSRRFLAVSPPFGAGGGPKRSGRNGRAGATAS